MRVDTYASEPHFADHLAPIHAALNDPGAFIVHRSLMAQSRWPAATDQPTDTSGPVLVASYGDVKRMREQGRTRIAFIEHGIGQSYGNHNGSYAGGRDRDDVSLFLVPNEYSARLWRDAYPAARVEVIGSVRAESLPPRDDSDGPTVCISFHWDCHMVPETESALNHYRSILPELNDRYRLIGHGHPRAFNPGRLDRVYRRSGVEAVHDFNEVSRRADLYICDNSSSIYEFAATGRPVVVLNQPAYRRDVHHGLRFWEAASVGIQVDRPADLPAAIDLALTDPPSVRKQREEALALVFGYRSGAAQRAAAIVTDWANRLGGQHP